MIVKWTGQVDAVGWYCNIVKLLRNDDAVCVTFHVRKVYEYGHMSALPPPGEERTHAACGSARSSALPSSPARHSSDVISPLCPPSSSSSVIPCVRAVGGTVEL